MKRGCLLIHGFGGNPEDVRPLKDYLTNYSDWNVQTVLLTGHGFHLDLKNASQEDWLNDCFKKYDDLKETCDIVDVVGFSMGGLLAIHLAVYRDVHHLVLLAPAVEIIRPKQLYFLTKEIFKKDEQQELTYEILKERFPEVHIRSYLELKLLQTNANRLLPKIDIPVFIALGKYDELIPYKPTAKWYKQLNVRKKKFILFGESGHFLCWDENNQTLERLIFQFLQKEVTH